MMSCHSLAVPIAAICSAFAIPSVAPIQGDNNRVGAADSVSSGVSTFRSIDRNVAVEHRGALLPDLPLVFLENHGQWNSPVRFAAHKGAVTIGVEPHVLTVAVERGGEVSSTSLRFVGASEDVALEAIDPLPGVVNMYRGHDTERWAEGLVQHERLAYRGLHEGIDVLLRTRGGQLEYDVLLAPDAELERFVVECGGVERIEVDPEGGLLLHTADGVLRQSPPVTWSEGPDGTRDPIDCRFRLVDDTRYGFELAERPNGRKVVIDPGLEWSTYLGGNGNDDLYEMERDAQGRLVLCGHAGSSGWALPGGSLSTNGGVDAFVVVLDPTLPAAQQVVWWTYFGGSDDEIAWDLELNAAGEVFASGGTRSADFPTTANAYDTVLGGVVDGWVVRLQPVTGTLLYSSLFGGGRAERAHRLLVQEPAIVTLGGATMSTNLPTTANAIQSNFLGARDCFIAVLDLDQAGAAGLQYLSYYGGNGQDGWISERQLDMEYAPTGELVLVSSSFAPNVPPGSTPPFAPNNAGGQDAFLSIIDLTVSGPAAVQYRTYIGGSGGDGVSNVAIDPTGGFIVTGFTYSDQFPITPGAAFPTFVGPMDRNDGWIVKIDPTLPPAEQFVYSTFLPGDGWEGIWDLEVDTNGTVFLSAWTNTSGSLTNSVPVTCGAYQEAYGGSGDAITGAITPAGNGLDDVHYLTYIGGSNFDFGGPILLEPGAGAPTVVQSSFTTSVDAPVDPAAFQGFFAGGSDALLTRLRLNPYLYCVAGANSVSPDGARICATGSTALADNALDLAVTDLPQNSPGYFLMSITPTAPFALPAPSGGSLCLGGPIVRFRAFVQNSGSQGQITFRPDLANIPPPGAPLLVGDTAHFQYWYRDIGSTSNTSNGVAVTLE